MCYILLVVVLFYFCARFLQLFYVDVGSLIL